MTDTPTEQLDEFLARADDVLTGWEGSDDAARWRDGEAVEFDLTPEQVAAMSSAVVAFTEGMGRAVQGMAAAVASVGAALNHWLRRREPKELPRSVPHSFRPDFDLRCTSPGCNLLPEEH